MALDEESRPQQSIDGDHDSSASGSDPGSTVVADAQHCRAESDEDGDDEKEKEVDLESTRSASSTIASILRRIDIHLLPYTCLLNFLSTLDKNNLGQAHARDLDDDLHLIGNQFATLLSVYFPAYLVLHYVCAAFVQQLRTQIFIPSLIVLCGLVTICMGRATTFVDMAVGRFLLGVFEGAITPCITILYTSWYPNEKMAMRITVFRLAAPLAGMTSALVCAAFYMIDGVQGLDGWRWMFLVEGLVTFFLAFPGYWLVPNFIEQEAHSYQRKLRRQKRQIETHETASWVDRIRPLLPPPCILQNDQRLVWSKMLIKQTGPTRRITPFTWPQILRPFIDLKMWLYFITAAANQIAHSNIISFGPEMVKSMGFHGNTINLLCAGPLAFSVLTMLLSAQISDRTQLRAVVLLPCLFLTAIGQLFLVVNASVPSTYLAIFLVAGFSYPCNSLLIAWCSSNAGPQWTKCSAMAVLMVSSTSASLVSSNIFPRSEAPRYFRGHLIGFISIVIANLATALLWFLIQRENKQREHEFPLATIDQDTLNAAMQYDLLCHRSNGAGEPVPDAAADDRDTVPTKSMTDDQARIFWHLTHLTNEEFAQLGERHPGVRLKL